MKITKRQLRRIIKEEKQLLQEAAPSAGALEFALDEYGKLRMNQEPLTARDLENEVTMILEKWLDDVTLDNGQVDTSRWGGLG
jgi:hypothetical protein